MPAARPPMGDGGYIEHWPGHRHWSALAKAPNFEQSIPTSFDFVDHADITDYARLPDRATPPDARVKHNPAVFLDLGAITRERVDTAAAGGASGHRVNEPASACAIHLRRNDG